MRVGRHRAGLASIRGLAVAAIAAIAVFATAAPAFAADPYPAGDKKPAQVLAQSFFNDPPAITVAASTTGGGGGQGTVAFTGLNLLILLLSALAALAIGLLLWRSAQPRPAPPNR